MSERYETVILHASGSIPGIPGDHAPGAYLIDWQERTITPVNTQEMRPDPEPEPVQSDETTPLAKRKSSK